MTEAPERRINLSEIVGSGYADFWRTKKRYRIAIGGRASKKSTTAALWYIVNTMKYEGANTLVVRRIYATHKDSTYAQLKWAIQDLGVESLWDCKLSPLEIVYKPTRQKILFRGLDDPMSITSITVSKGYLCWCWFEEFFQVTDENDFNMIDGSIRGKLPEPLFKQITGTMNPWNEKHWIKKRFFDSIDENAFTMRSTYECNEFLGEDDIRFFTSMKEKNPRRYNIEGLGNWGVAEGLIYNNWREEAFDFNELVKKIPGIQSAFGLDFGYTADPTAFICAMIDEAGKRIFIFDEHYQRGMLNNEIAEMLKYKARQKELIIADSAEPKSIEELRKYGIERIRPARKGKDSVANGIQFISQFEIIVHPSCSNAMLELNNYSWEQKDGHATNRPESGYDHLMDALRYAVERFLVKSQIWLLSSSRSN